MAPPHLPPPPILDRYDLSLIVRTCKTFCDLTIKLLYRHVVWKNPMSLIHSLGFLRRVWELDQESFVLPKFLTIGVSQMSMNERSAIVGEDARILSAQRGRSTHMTWIGRWDYTLFAVLKNRDTAYDFWIALFADAAVHGSMLDFSQSLVNLRELTFVNAILPDTIHSLLHRFLKLRKPHLEMCIKMCIISPRFPNEDADHTILPITKLSLGVCIMRSRNPLCRCHRPVSTLFHCPMAPPNLKQLSPHRPKMTKNDCWMASVGPTQWKVHENASLVLNVSLFLVGTPNIESISTCFAFFDPNFQMPFVQA